MQLRILNLIFGEPDRGFYGSELIRLAGSGSGAVQRELTRMAEAGLVNIAISGNRKIYKANRQSPIFAELHGIIQKTTGLVEPLRTVLKKFGGKISFAFVYGSIAKQKDTATSDIDLLIAGNDLSYSEVFDALQKAEAVLHRPINPNLMTPHEWQQKIAAKNAFARKISEQPKLFVIGNENELQRTR